MEAPPIRTAEAGPQELIWAARICYLEATFRESDCAAMLHVARKRAARTGAAWLDALRAHSVLERSGTPRAREVRLFPWGDVAGMGKRWNTRWAELRDLVTHFEAGLVDDPCPRAELWGGTMDPQLKGTVPARCSARTANTFYALRSRRRVVDAVLASAVRP